MASTAASSKQTASTSKQGSTKTSNGRAANRTADRSVRQTGQRAVDVPVGAVLSARDRVTGVVQPWTRSESRSKELKGLRNQVQTELDRFERRGSEARRTAAGRVREGRGLVSKQVRTFPATVMHGRERVEGSLRKARDTVRQRVSSSPAAS